MGKTMTKLLFDHFVVLMLENRSFDHLFGYLGIGDGLPRGGATNYPDPSKKGEAFSSRKGLEYDLKRAPTSSELQQVMNCFDPVQLPVLSTLAKSFVLCDRWFADVPGPTMPNRAFVHAATSQGYTY